jgi:hypothetical protein
MKIDPKEVIQAYKELGYKPIRFTWYLDSKKCCCALTALAMKEGVSRKTTCILAWAEQNFGEKWVSGFTAGFDGAEVNNIEACPEEFQDGYFNGIAVANEVFKELVVI